MLYTVYWLPINVLYCFIIFLSASQILYGCNNRISPHLLMKVYLFHSLILWLYGSHSISITLSLSLSLYVREGVWRDAYSSMHCRFWQAQGEKEDGETELGQWVAELPAASFRVLDVWGGTGSPWANTDITGSAFSCLGRQPYVNITSIPTHMLPNMTAPTLWCWVKLLTAVTWTITFSY